MKTDFHLKLESMCRIGRGEGKHWVLRGSETVRVPGSNTVVTTKAAIYSAFLGEIPPGQCPRTVCGNSLCVRPDHQALRHHPGARGLNLNEYVAVLPSKRRGRGRLLPQILPEGLTIKAIRAVKFLAKRGNSLAQMAAATELSVAEVVRIRGGMYDDAVKNLEKAREKRMAAEPKSVADIPGGGMPEAPAASPTPLEDIEDLSEEERAWIGSIR